MILIHRGIGVVSASQIRGRHLHVKSLCLCCVPEPLERERETIPYQLFRSCILVCWGFFSDTGHVCYHSVLPALEQIIPLTPLSLLVEGQQRKKPALAAEALVDVSVPPGRLCRCLLPICWGKREGGGAQKRFQKGSFVI